MKKGSKITLIVICILVSLLLAVVIFGGGIIFGAMLSEKAYQQVEYNRQALKYKSAEIVEMYQAFVIQVERRGGPIERKDVELLYKKIGEITNDENLKILAMSAMEEALINGSPTNLFGGPAFLGFVYANEKTLLEE